MAQHDSYRVTATLVPDAGTPALLRVVSVLHSRGVAVEALRFSTSRDTEVTVTADVRSGNVGPTTLEASLRRVLEVVEVRTAPQRRLEPVGDAGAGGR
jgi:acetolactate synthase regulatory subunit